MAEIILNDEQLEAVRAATEAVAIRDKHGNLVGFVSPPHNQEEIAEARRRLHSDGPWLSTQQVLDHLDSMEQG